MTFRNFYDLIWLSYEFQTVKSPSTLWLTHSVRPSCSGNDILIGHLNSISRWSRNYQAIKMQLNPGGLASPAGPLVFMMKMGPPIPPPD